MFGKTVISGICVAVLAAAAGDSRLSEAAMRGDRAAVKSLLAQKVDVDGAQGDGTTALHWAAFRDDLETAKILIQAGANVRVTTREGGITPLIMACTNGSAPMIQLLLNAGADVNQAKTNGTTPLMTAAASGSAEAVKILLDHGADVNAKESAHGQTALMFAAALNRDAVIRVLMAHKADPSIATSVTKVVRVRFDQDGNIVEDRPGGGRGGAGARREMTAEQQDKADEAADAAAAAEKMKRANEQQQADLDLLAKAINAKGSVYLVAKPKPRAGDISFRAPRRIGPEYAGGMTALLYAAREGHMEAVKALVESGADINQQSADKFTPLVEALANGHLDVAKYLVDKGADVKLASVSGLTPLYAVIDVQWAPHVWFPQPSTEQEKTNYLDLMKEIIEKGADVNAAINEKLWFRSFTNDYTWVDPAGATPFWRAAQSSDTAAMKLLVEHGADPKKATKSGDTPLHAAAGIGWAANWSVNAPEDPLDAVKMCVELGNDVNAADNRGYTPLHGAAYLGNNDMVNYLVSKGANVKAVTKAGDTVADLANGPNRFGQPHPETVALLEKLGSANSHNCRSDQCVVASSASIYDRPLTKEEQAEKDILDALAVASGMKEAKFIPDVPAGRFFPGGK
ncbi:MAG TPA: ankyrin repeat domain-containing protein [Bryobacteraceae bacterium]|jgi:ankyrin repeat protein|nr:ankyrin repeat domain-containing protein [Bryobacteraceae bacterium]